MNKKQIKELLLGSKRLNNLKKPKEIKNPLRNPPDVSNDIPLGERTKW